jgi:hypothetical protein
MMPAEDEAVEEAIRVLSELMDQRPMRTPMDQPSFDQDENGDPQPDALVEFSDTTFIMEYKDSGTVSSVEAGIRQLEQLPQRLDTAIKLLVVPYMHRLGEERCKTAGISWLDLSGNAEIRAPRVRVSIRGKQNQYKRPGRPRNPFASKGSRITRHLLYQSKESHRQSELAEITGLSKSYVSYVVNTLERQGLIGRNWDGSVKVRDAELLMDAWLEAYKFNKHEIVRGHMAARSGNSLLRILSTRLSDLGIEYAATGLAAAWLYSKFSAFRLVTVFIRKPILSSELSEIGVTGGESGANTWLVLPADESVFWESTSLEDIPTVHPIQAYLDLKDHPERSSEAADELRRIAIGSWRSD